MSWVLGTGGLQQPQHQCLRCPHPYSPSWEPEAEEGVVAPRSDKTF